MVLNSVKIYGENVGRSMRKQYVEASGPAWEEVGHDFHLRYRPKRFTRSHARAAGYEKRNRKYNDFKWRRFKHSNPLEKTGEVKRLVKTARVEARLGTGQEKNRGGVKVTYRGARKLNFKTRFTKINMVAEFTHVTERETQELGMNFQTRFEPRFNKK